MAFGGRMDGCGQFVKYGLFLINLIIFIGGAVVFGIGLWILIDNSYVNELLGTNLYIGAVYVLLVTSAIVCIISFFGCFAASKEIKCMLLTYFIILFLLFVIMLIGGILGFVFREKVQQTLRQEMQTSMKLYGHRRPVTWAWDQTQIRLKCCGIESYRDWQGRIPESCCKGVELDNYNNLYSGVESRCVRAPSPITTNIYGCRNATAVFIKDKAAIIGGTGIGVAVLMIIGMILSCSLFKMIE